MKNVFAINIDFENGIIPRGALAFASTEVRPKDGNIIIYLDNYSKVSVGYYSQSSEAFSINGYRKISGHVNHLNSKIRWLFPILYYEVVTF